MGEGEGEREGRGQVTFCGSEVTRPLCVSCLITEKIQIEPLKTKCFALWSTEKNSRRTSYLKLNFFNKHFLFRKLKMPEYHPESHCVPCGCAQRPQSTLA